MQAPQSSDHDRIPSSRAKGGRLTNFHIAISAFAAVAGVVFAGIQTFLPGSSPQPINLTLAVGPTASTDKASGLGAETAPAVPAYQLAALQLDGRTTISGAFKDQSAGRYAYRDLFDGRPETFVTVEAPENEINVLVDLPEAEVVGGIEYTPPPDAGRFAPAAVLDVMVLPEGQLEASGRPVTSFALQGGPGSQTFSLPAKSLGKGLWLRIAGPAGMGDVAVGDIKVLRAVR